MRNYLIVAFFAAIFVSPHLAFSGSIDGSSPCLCAITDVVECDSQGECIEVEPEDINIPTFIKIDFQKKTLAGVDGADDKTTVINSEQNGGKLILQGAENQRAWSMMVTKETGEMSASVSGEDYGFLLFGDCTVMPE